MEALTLAPVEPRVALALLDGVERHDPRGIATFADLAAMCEAGHCYAATKPGAQAVYILKSRNGQLWIDACKGGARAPMAAELLGAVELQARATGHASIAFQTARRGLVHVAESQGFNVTGWVLKKELPLWT